jgi:hypothetical protein
MVDAFEIITKGAEMMAHRLVLSQKHIAELEAANEAATQQKSHKRKRIQKEVIPTVVEGVRLTTLKKFAAHSDGKQVKKRARVEVGKPPQGRCGRCGKAEHNSRTCK